MGTKIIIRDKSRPMDNTFTHEEFLMDGDKEETDIDTFLAEEDEDEEGADDEDEEKDADEDEEEETI